MSFDTAEEGFESQINAHGNILQDLGMDPFEGKAFLFQCQKCINLSIAGQAFPSLLIGFFPIGKQVVIEPTTLFERERYDTETFYACLCCSTNWTGMQAGSRSTPAPNKERPFYP